MAAQVCTLREISEHALDFCEHERVVGVGTQETQHFVQAVHCTGSGQAYPSNTVQQRKLDLGACATVDALCLLKSRKCGDLHRSAATAPPGSCPLPTCSPR